MSEVNDLFQEFERGSDAIKEKLAKSFYELGKEAGIQAERERIVELLKSSLLMAVDEKANLVVGRELMNVDRTSAALVMTGLIWAIENREEEK